jgi:predicted ATPase/DNA-binding SARP family transcriptional activator
LLGPIQLARGDTRLSGQVSTRVMTLLVILALEPDILHRRDALAALLWPDQPRENARHSLRQALSTLRRTLGDNDETAAIVSEGGGIALHLNGTVWLDTSEFLDLLDACERHAHRRLETCAPCARRLEQAVGLYRGELCATLDVSDSGELEAWLQVHRERLHRRAVQALAALASHHVHLGQYEHARRLVERELELEPWRESAHRELMRIHLAMGNRPAALQQFETCRQALADELGIEPEPETVALHEQIRSGASPDGVIVTAAAASRPMRASPMIAATPIIGRERDIERIVDLLTLAECRLLTLTGPGGIGKTRLAMQVALDLNTSVTHGAHVVSLAPVRTPDLLVPTIAEALGMAHQGRGDQLQQLMTQLRDRQMLLVLDNMEHLLESSTVLATILVHAPDVTMLVTSRERLGLQAEWVYPVEGLDVPTPGESGDITDAASVRLFLSGLRRVRPHAPVRDQEMPAIAEICRLVEGMPLAIELAASWSATLPVETIVSEIEQSIDFLVIPLRDVPPRHRSMRAVFDQSWDLLAPEERRVFQRLSLFHGGFSREAAEQVAGATLPVLSSLVSTSFLRTDGNGRYGVHELLRQYGEAQLAAHHREQVMTRDRYSRHFLAFVADRERDLTGARQRQALAELTCEIANIRHAWRCALQLNLREPIDAAIHGLWLFYVLRGWMREGESAFSEAAEAFEAVDDAPVADRLVLAKAMTRQGGFKSGLGHYEPAIAHIRAGIETLRELDARRELALALNFLAAAIHLSGAEEDEQRLLEESLALFRSVGDPWGEAYALNDLAMLTHSRGDTEAASELCRQSEALFRSIQDSRGLAFAAHHLGIFALAAGDLTASRVHHRRALALRTESEDEWGVAASLLNLGLVERRDGNLDEAESLLIEALRSARQAWVLPVVLEVLVELAAVQIDRGATQRPAEILAAVAQETAAGWQIRQRAERLVAELERVLPEFDRIDLHERAATVTVDRLAGSFLS